MPVPPAERIGSGAWCFRTKECSRTVRHHAGPADGAVCHVGVVLPDERIRVCRR